MSNTNNLSIDLVASNQAQKEVTINEAISKIDAILNVGAINIWLDVPPGSPSEGDLYVVGNAPSGAWAENAEEIAYYNAGWKFIAPKSGMRIWSNDKKLPYIYNGSAWKALSYERVEVQSVSSSSGVLTLDLNSANVFSATMVEDITSISLVNMPTSGEVIYVKIFLQQDTTGGWVLSFPASVNFIGAVAPTLNNSANAMNFLELKTIDGGGNWFLTTDSY